MPNEADTCRKFVVPRLPAAGWDNESHSIAEQRTFKAGHILNAKQDGLAVKYIMNSPRLSPYEFFAEHPKLLARIQAT